MYEVSPKALRFPVKHRQTAVRCLTAGTHLECKVLSGKVCVSFGRLPLQK